ncbi:MAG: hypothetical protein ABIA75_11380 [Candidatus Neomarinimicrobiota bacterium]
MKNLFLIAIGILILAAFGGGCRETFEASELELSDYAWEQYEKGAYLESYTWFREAVVVDSVYQDGYNGLGWSLGQLAEFDSSTYYFSLGLACPQPKDVTATIRHEIWAGLTFAHQAAGEDQQAVVYGDSLLDDLTDITRFPTASWTFSHDADLNHLDLRLALATANYNLGRFNLTNSHIQAILLAVAATDTFSVDTTTVLGRQALAEKIEELREVLAP